MGALKTKTGDKVRDALIDSLARTRDPVHLRLAKLSGDDSKLTAHDELTRALRAGEPVTVSADQLGDALMVAGARIDHVRRVDRIGGRWIVESDGAYHQPKTSRRKAGPTEGAP
ncbi:MAG: hypothetical protein WEA10_05005 [Actinomycetota bacterium]